MENKEKEIQEIYIKYAQRSLIDCENMSEEEEKKYLIEKEKEMRAELKKIKEQTTQK